MYAHIIFSEIEKVEERSTPHHLLMKAVVINSSPDMLPDVVKTILIPPTLFFIFPCHLFYVGFMILETKFNKITKLS